MIVIPLVNAGQRVTAGIISEDYSQGDTSTTTVTAASLTALSKIFTIPAGDAGANTAYRITCGGNGVWGSTQQTLQFGVSFGSSTLGNLQTIGFTEFATSAAFRWYGQLMVVCVAPGSTATWKGGYLVTLSNTAATELSYAGPSAANATIAIADSATTGVTLDSTVAQNLSLKAAWGATTGAPTISCQWSVFEKLGG